MSVAGQSRQAIRAECSDELLLRHPPVWISRKGIGPAALKLSPLFAKLARPRGYTENPLNLGRYEHAVLLAFRVFDMI